MIEQETENLIKQQKEMIDNQKIDFDAYLKGINKSEEEFEDEISKSADIRLKRAIIIEEIVNYYEVKIDDKIINNDADFITNSFSEMHPADAADIIEHLS